MGLGRQAAGVVWLDTGCAEPHPVARGARGAGPRPEARGGELGTTRMGESRRRAGVWGRGAPARMSRTRLVPPRRVNWAAPPSEEKG